MADWTQLPQELLELISQRLETCFDRVHFRSVCRSWRSSIPPSSRRLYVSCSLPIFDGWHRYENEKYCYLEKIPVFLFRFVQNSDNRTSSAHTACWLAEIHERTYGKMELLYPFGCKSILSKSQIWLNTLNCQILSLGHRYRIWYRGIKYSGDMRIFTGEAAFLQLDKEDKDFAVLIRGSGNMVMFKTTNMRWTEVENTRQTCSDMVSFKGKFYAITEEGRTIVVEPSLDVSIIPNIGAREGKKFLIQSGSDLLLIQIVPPMRVSSSSYDLEKLICCRVFKLDEEAKKWVRIDNLGNCVLSLSWGWKFCCSGNKLPDLKGNCIILRTFGLDIQIPANIIMFNLEDGSVRRIDDIEGYQGMFRPNLKSAISNGFVTSQDTQASSRPDA